MADQPPTSNFGNQSFQGQNLPMRHYGAAQVGSSSELSSKLPQDEGQGKEGDPGKFQSMQEFHKGLTKSGGNKVLKILIPVFIFIVLLIAAAFYWKSKMQGENLLGKKGEIVWWGIQMEEGEINPLIEEYKKENPGVNITYIKQSTQDYRERLANSLALGNGPDIFEIHNSWPVMFKGELSVAPSDIMSVSEFQSTYYPVCAKDLTDKNGVVAIPLEYDALTLFYNEDIFAAAAKTPPTTWDELKNVSAELVLKEKSSYVQSSVAFGTEENIEHWPEILALMLIQNDAKLSDPNNKDATDAMSFFSLIGKNSGWSNAYPPSVIYFARERVAMIFAPTKRAHEIIKENPNINFRATSLPQLPKGSPDDPDYSYATYWAYGVWDRSVNKNEAWKFLKYLSSKESLSFLNSQVKMSRGVEILPSRVDMALDYAKHPILGSVVGLADSAKSWYLSGLTYDGETGVNTAIGKIYQEIMTKGGEEKKKALQNAATRIKTILASYSLKK